MNVGTPVDRKHLMNNKIREDERGDQKKKSKINFRLNENQLRYIRILKVKFNRIFTDFCFHRCDKKEHASSACTAKKTPENELTTFDEGFSLHHIPQEKPLCSSHLAGRYPNSITFDNLEAMNQYQTVSYIFA